MGKGFNYLLTYFDIKKINNNNNVIYILKPTIEDLQLLFGEVSLGFKLLKTLRPVTHHRHLKLIICFIYEEDKERTSKKKPYYPVKTSTINGLTCLLSGVLTFENSRKYRQLSSFCKCEAGKNLNRKQKNALRTKE